MDFSKRIKASRIKAKFNSPTRFIRRNDYQRSPRATSAADERYSLDGVLADAAALSHDMKTTTELKIDYVFLSWNYDFPSEIETAIEGDYVANPHLYDEGALKQVAALLLVAPDASPKCALDVVRRYRSDVQ